MTVQLSNNQHHTIRRLCSIQIDSLTDIARQEKHIHVDLQIIGLDVDKHDVDKVISSQLDTFNNLYDSPNSLFSLDDINIDLIKHLLINYNDSKLDKSDTANLWHKIFLNEYHREHTSIN